MVEKLIDTLSWDEIVDKIQNDTKNTSPRFKTWLKSKKDLGGTFFSSIMWLRLYNIQKAVNLQDHDHFIVVSGKEGCGKSTLAIQLAAVLDPTFNLNRICFNLEEYIEKIRDIKPGSVFILDEGNMFLFSRESYSESNRLMVKLFALMRQKNLITIICVPNFFTLDSYVRDHRVDSLVFVTKRGNSLCYVKKAIKIISKEGKQTKNVGGHKCPPGTFFLNSFNKDIPCLNGLDRKTYIKYKENHFKDFLDEIYEMVRKRDSKSKYISISQAQKLIPISDYVLKRLVNQKKLRGKKIGGKYFVERAHLLDNEHLEG